MAGLFNMLPRLTPNDLINRERGNVEYFSNVFLLHALTMQRPYLFYISFSQFCLSVGRSLLILTTTLANHVGVIVGGRPQKQMLGIDASSVVAFMANVQRLVESTIRQFIGKTVSRTGRLLTGQSEFAIAANIHPARPEPARFSFRDVFGKPYFSRRWLSAGWHFINASMPAESLVMHRAVTKRTIQHRSLAFPNGADFRWL